MVDYNYLVGFVVEPLLEGKVVVVLQWVEEYRNLVEDNCCGSLSNLDMELDCLVDSQVDLEEDIDLAGDIVLAGDTVQRIVLDDKLFEDMVEEVLQVVEEQEVACIQVAVDDYSYSFVVVLESVGLVVVHVLEEHPVEAVTMHAYFVMNRLDLPDRQDFYAKPVGTAYILELSLCFDNPEWFELNDHFHQAFSEFAEVLAVVFVRVVQTLETFSSNSITRNNQCGPKEVHETPAMEISLLCCYK